MINVDSRSRPRSWPRRQDRHELGNPRPPALPCDMSGNHSALGAGNKLALTLPRFGPLFRQFSALESCSAPQLAGVLRHPAAMTRRMGRLCGDRYYGEQGIGLPEQIGGVKPGACLPGLSGGRTTRPSYRRTDRRGRLRSEEISVHHHRRNGAEPPPPEDPATRGLVVCLPSEAARVERISDSRALCGAH